MQLPVGVKLKEFCALVIVSFIFLVSLVQSQEKNGVIHNPLVDGYYADPTIIK